MDDITNDVEGNGGDLLLLLKLGTNCEEIGNRSEVSGLSKYLPGETDESRSICAGVAKSIWSPATRRMAVIHLRHKQDYFLAHSIQTGSAAHTTSYATATGGCFPACKVAGKNVNATLVLRSSMT
jgi:hypothetical protein